MIPNCDATLNTVRQCVLSIYTTMKAYMDFRAFTVLLTF